MIYHLTTHVLNHKMAASQTCGSISKIGCNASKLVPSSYQYKLNRNQHPQSPPRQMQRSRPPVSGAYLRNQPAQMHLLAKHSPPRAPYGHQHGTAALIPCQILAGARITGFLCPLVARSIVSGEVLASVLRAAFEEPVIKHAIRALGALQRIWAR